MLGRLVLLLSLILRGSLVLLGGCRLLRCLVLLGRCRLLLSGILLRIPSNRGSGVVLPIRVKSLLLIPRGLWITISLLRIARRVRLSTRLRIAHLLLAGIRRLLVGLLLRPLSAPPHLGVVILIAGVATPDTKPARTQQGIQNSLPETESLQSYDHCYCHKSCSQHCHSPCSPTAGAEVCGKRTGIGISTLS